MRALLPLATGGLLLSSISLAQAADPVLLAETGAYLLGNAQRCGVSAERVTKAGRVIHDMVGSITTEIKDKQVADARFFAIFWRAASSSGDKELLNAPCDVVLAQFKRLEDHHRQAGFAD